MKKEYIILLAVSTIFLAVIAIISLDRTSPKQATLAENNLEKNQRIQSEESEKKEEVKNNEEGKSMPATYSANKSLSKPEMIIDQEKQYLATLHTSEGDIVIQLNAAMTPITVNNFVYLAQKNFYDKTIFHRIIKGFMIQGGDPRGDGTGGPGYRFADEAFEGDYLRGSVAMANAGPNTNGSQFFIMHQDYALPKNYVIFGQVVEGMAVVDAIAEAEVKSSFSGESSQPVNPVQIQTVEVSAQ